MLNWDSSRWTRARVVELALALLGLFGALALSNCLGRYASHAGETAHTSPDLLLSFLPVVDLRIVFVWGYAAFVGWAVVMGVLQEQRRLAHITWLFALIIVLRSLFIILTPMHSPEGALLANGDPLFDAIGRHLTFHNDLFFSSHTAMPFLGYLVYRRRLTSLVFLAMSVMLAFTVLLTRVHYSIDVFSAYFITYAVYRFERRRLRLPYRKMRHSIIGWLA